MKKILVAYFSASGVTAAVAKKIAAASGGDLFEIKPAIPYTPADLNWMDKNSRSSVEMKNSSSRPEIAEKLTSLDDYDTIFLGFPIWWYVAPTIISTFLESYDFSGKTIVPFATSGSSGLGKTVDVLKTVCPSAEFEQGKLMNHLSDNEIENWINEIINK